MINFFVTGDIMMMSYLRGVANEALVFTARLWCLIIPTHGTSGDREGRWNNQNGNMGMGHSETNVESSHCVKQWVWNE